MISVSSSGEGITREGCDIVNAGQLKCRSRWFGARIFQIIVALLSDRITNNHYSLLLVAGTYICGMFNDYVACNLHYNLISLAKSLNEFFGVAFTLT